MASAIQILIQRIQFRGQDIDLGHLIDSAYIEKADPWGPLLILRYNDTNSLIRDDYGVTEKDELKVTIGNPVTEDDLHLVENFTIFSMVLNGPVLTINCVQSDIYKLISPAASAHIYRAKSGLFVCKSLLASSGISYASGKNPIIEDYHLLPNSRPLNLIRRMARETGRLAWLSRGVFTLKSFDELMAEGNGIDYHFNDSRQTNQIANYDLLESRWKKQDIAEKSYTAFDFKQGVVSSGSGPAEWMGVTNKNTLTAMADIPLPSVLFLANGNGALKPGEAINFHWNKAQSTQVLDESLPAKGLVYQVTHYSKKNTYQNKVMTLVSGK